MSPAAPVRTRSLGQEEVSRAGWVSFLFQTEDGNCSLNDSLDLLVGEGLWADRFKEMILVGQAKVVDTEIAFFLHLGLIQSTFDCPRGNFPQI